MSTLFIQQVVFLVVPSVTWRREFCVGPFDFWFNRKQETKEKNERTDEWMNIKWDFCLIVNFWDCFGVLNNYYVRRINRLLSGLEWRAAPGQRTYWSRWRNWTNRWASRSRPSWQEERQLRPRSAKLFKQDERRKRNEKKKTKFEWEIIIGSNLCR